MQKDSVNTLKYKACQAGSKKGFKNREKVLTRLGRLDYTGFLKGLRIIERLYPMYTGKNPLNPLIYKGFRLVSYEVGRRKEKGYFESNKLCCVLVTTVLSIRYDSFQKVGMLKLLRVLTCKKLPCVHIACARGKQVAVLRHMWEWANTINFLSCLIP